MAARDLVFKEQWGYLQLAHGEVVRTEAQPSRPVGVLGWLRDAYGFRLFTYRRNMSGSGVLPGELQSRSQVVVTDLSSGSTTSATKAGAWVADREVGGLLIVHDDAGGAGAAPEGEASIIIASTADTVTLDPDLPLTAALAVNDDVTTLAPHLVDAVPDDPVWVVCGVAMGAPAHQSYGWWQVQGVHPRAKHTDASVTKNDALKAGAAAVQAFGSATAVTGGNLHQVIGYQLATHTLDVQGDESPIFLCLFPAYW